MVMRKLSVFVSSISKLLSELILQVRAESE